MNRNEIIMCIDQWSEKLGSDKAVADFVGISPAAISTIRSGKYGASENTMLQKIAKVLNYKPKKWNVVRTLEGYKRLERLVSDAKEESMWFLISEPAGKGKSMPLEDIFNLDRSGSIHFLQCEEWSARQFMIKLVSRTVGAEALKGRYKTIAQLMDIIADYFNGKSLEKPVLIIDEGDKLRPSALRTLIPLFNRTEDRLGLILSGSENLRKEIKHGIRFRKKGYDELESRFGRTYISLPGIREHESFQISAANGITDKDKQLEIWRTLPKEEREVKVKLKNSEKESTKKVMYASDLRIQKSLIKGIKLRLKYA